MKADPLSKAHYSIAAVSKLSGVSCHTLRVWERRYGFPVPERLESGHRRYPAQQVDLICQVARRCQCGGSIAQHIAEARAGHPPPPPIDQTPPVTSQRTSELIDTLQRADARTAEVIYEHLTTGLAPAEIANAILTPALTEAGERLFRNDCSIVEERLATMFLLRKLAALVDDAQRANSSPLGRVIVFVMQGDRHEGGALMLSLALELAGWRSLFLGADLPIREVQRGIDRWKPVAVGVSLSLSRNIRKRFDELESLHGAPIFVGGRSLLNYQGLARQCGFGVVRGPAIPNVGRYLEELVGRGRQNNHCRVCIAPETTGHPLDDTQAEEFSEWHTNDAMKPDSQTDLTS
ncbi:MerR family transcriptional regulator [Tautonia rosea]|uniref:MerR family transcriptional regulator n=1 Tax=Tautonia rosea TaxID=2728037 RepID=UPI001475D060|nr:MerR family transcriptional regulator [Tautonia rosea]